MQATPARLVAITAALVLLALPAVVFADPDGTATVRFGRSDIGSPFDPRSGHDQSAHAKDSLFPRTVTIARGGSVTYLRDGFHQVAIYEPDTRPEDIAVTRLDRGLIDDPEDRVARGPRPQEGWTTWTTPSGTFDERGRYLVICTVPGHFTNFDMYGWVNVK